MKKNQFTVMICLALLAILNLSHTSNAQDAKPRKSPKAAVTQKIGVDTDIVINYSRPGVKGRTIWGDLVPYGMFAGNSFSNNNAFPWRAGADENTTIEFNKDVMINGQKLAAGKYSIHMVAGKTEFQVMFNRKTDGWGSYTYNAADNALVVSVSPVESAHTEWLEYSFEDLADYSAVACLKWDNLKVPFRIEAGK
ncbi:MAG: DUF2911 domain-containing protein [Cyclobacteriaceae bacterium]|nr:DUF2911 domain-containing protein [Cyclobacteriaceae bacterium]